MILTSELILNLISTGLNMIFIILMAVLVFHLLKKRSKSVKQINKLRSRIIYISIIIFILIAIKIWFGGVSHLLTMLSLVAAGLVIVNKETVMNFVGWIIINWRSLFSEGDHVQIQNYHGYVTEIKLFYFRMYETIEHGNKKTTGKLLKIPNALVITSPISTFTCDENISLHTTSYLISINNDITNITKKAEDLIKNIILYKYKFDPSFSKSLIISKHKLKQVAITNFMPEITIKPLADKEYILNIQASYYCFIDDKIELEQKYIQELIKEIKNISAS